MLKHHLYVSTCNIDPDKRSEEIVRLATVSKENNARSSVTGALVFSGARFAHYLEGPPAEVESTLARIRADVRHEHMTTLQEGYSTERIFQNWSLSYGRPSLYVDRHIQALIGSNENQPGRDRQVEQLMRLVRGLTQLHESGRRPSPERVLSRHQEVEVFLRLKRRKG